MKKTNFIILFICTFFISCASTKNNFDNYEYDDEDNYEYEDSYSEEVTAIEIPETTEDFLGNFEPISLESIMVLKKSKNTVKPVEIRKNYLIPRTNSIELTFRDKANEVCIVFNKAERDKILEACNLFLTQYEEKSIPHNKVNSKTAYFQSKCSLWFGVVSSENGCSNTDYYVNCEFIDKRPYLIICFIPTRCDEINAYTPKVSFYMSPSQIRDFMEIIKQENLEALLTEKREKAYTY